MGWVRAAWIVLLFGAAVATPGLAADPVPAAEPEFAYALSHELMSPFCPGRSLASCPSDQAAELVQWIVLQEAAGATREEVISVLEARFGDVIKSAPEPEGWGLAAWALPGAMLGFGALLVVVVLRRLVDRGAGEGQPGPKAAPAIGAPIAEDGDLARQIDAEFEASQR